MTDEKKKDYTSRIAAANPTMLCVILYEIALDYLEEAIEKHAAQDREGFRMVLELAQSAVFEMVLSVQDGQEISGNLRGLYGFCQKQLAKAIAGNRVEPLENVRDVLQKLHDAYLEISSQDSRGPVMSNTQTVYTGLTYGKSMLGQNMVGDCGNRGFCV